MLLVLKRTFIQENRAVQNVQNPRNTVMSDFLDTKWEGIFRMLTFLGAFLTDFLKFKLEEF